MLEVEIFSDVICPWCFIGKRRLDTVLATELGEDVALRWRPFLLYPNIPLEGVDRSELLKRRYGDEADAARVPERIAQEAEAEGLTFRFDLIRRTPNTLLAHRILEYAYAQGCQHELAEALFQGYFCEGLDVGDAAILTKMAAKLGLDEAEVSAFLNGELFVEEIQTQLARAPELGISGVPGYYLANAFLLPGAQTSEVMGQILTRVKTRLAERQA
ncbi:MAG: putative DsbA family dithiol-disulfide isomerase [Limisphaerales bacterium]|jgi:predicted DsbA family dithiol-disulfide isomerase